MCTTSLLFVSFVGIFGKFCRRTKIQIFVLLSQYYVNITNFQITLQKYVKVVWWRSTHENLAKDRHFAIILSSKSMCTHRHIYWRYTEPSQYDTFPEIHTLFKTPQNVPLGAHTFQNCNNKKYKTVPLFSWVRRHCTTKTPFFKAKTK